MHFSCVVFLMLLQDECSLKGKSSRVRILFLSLFFCSWMRTIDCTQTNMTTEAAVIDFEEKKKKPSTESDVKLSV